MLRKLIVLILSSVVLAGCDNATSSTNEAKDLRWMDRTIYLAHPDASDTNRNNFFQKQKVREALQELEEMTNLGENYFNFQEADESELNTSLDPNSFESEQKSFIVIWPDDVFNNYLATQVNGTVPDQNAIAVLNAANKRKFFIIVRASCLASATNTTSSSCSNLGLPGLKALIDRQMGLLVGMATKDCNLFSTDIMCASAPSDNQYSDNSKLRFSAAFNNSLEAIRLNPSFYNQ